MWCFSILCSIYSLQGHQPFQWKTIVTVYQFCLDTIESLYLLYIDLNRSKVCLYSIPWSLFSFQSCFRICSWCRAPRHLVYILVFIYIYIYIYIYIFTYLGQNKQPLDDRSMFVKERHHFVCLRHFMQFVSKSCSLGNFGIFNDFGQEILGLSFLFGLFQVCSNLFQVLEVKNVKFALFVQSCIVESCKSWSNL